MSILYIGFTGWRRQLRRSFYMPLFGGIPLPPLTWSHSSWQAGKSSYRRGALTSPVGSVSQARKKSGWFPLFFLTFYIPVRGSTNHPGRSAGIHRSRSLCRSCRHGSPGSRSALGPGTSYSSCCHCYRQIHCSRQEKSDQQQPGK